ncbi:terminase large subunit domain-containing protein [Synechococcus sp. PCC 6312]|uniref:terminase large subunit domain-containing protein n=1 Tax=Synechococcus sp. (strain ATCC 27167 / PCC 6312) TaxID=195253 RepID=UPI00029F18B1|nr:terminase family protein [Synechococcus sp. PCC 6312]AFY60345.1 Mu-like prophage FluMu protein gp28 [Synechococcus sp. PCC 6312]
MESSSLIELYPYQKRWLTDASRFKIGMFSRQTGKTFTTCLEIVLDCLKTEAEGGRARWVILSRGERQAKEAMDEGVKRFLKLLNVLFEAHDYDWEGSFKALEVELPGGSKITALPANPDTARGFSANCFLDEFAFHKDSRAIWQALFPVISKPGLKLRITSTPNGKGNKFYELVTAAEERRDETPWSLHRVDIYQAVADGLPRDIEQLRKALNDPDSWSQEFELEWLDEASAWLTYELINAVEHSDAGKPDLYTHQPVYLGLDLAVRRDLWVATVLEPVGDVLWSREIVAKRRPSYAEREAIVVGLFERYRVGRLCIDQTGLGEDITVRYQKLFGEFRVEGILFTTPNKLVLANGIKEAFEDRKIRIPIDPQLREDLHKIKKIVTPTGAMRFDADSDSQGHADRFWSLALAIQAASSPAAPIEFHALEPDAPDLTGWADELSLIGGGW